MSREQSVKHVPSPYIDKSLRWADLAVLSTFGGPSTVIRPLFDISDDADLDLAPTPGMHARPLAAATKRWRTWFSRFDSLAPRLAIHLVTDGKLNRYDVSKIERLIAEGIDVFVHSWHTSCEVVPGLAPYLIEHDLADNGD
jgi:hypothetical protein